MKNIDGSADEDVLVDRLGVVSSWSADGKYLVFSNQGRMFLWELGTKGEPVAIGSRSGASRDGQVSPDGGWIAYVSGESGNAEIYVAPLPPGTGRLQVSAAGGTNPHWGKKSGELFYVSPDRMLMAVDIHRDHGLSAGIPRKLFQRGESFGNSDYDVTADGQIFMISRPRDELPDAPITVVLNWWVDLMKRPN